jgi:Uma2 family endonuclease
MKRKPFAKASRIGYSPYMLGQPKHRFRVREYYRMGETGVLPPDARVELLAGEIIDMSPIGPFHGGAVGLLTQWFNELSRRRWLVWPQNPLHLDDYSEPQPDVMLLKPAPGNYTRQHPRPEDVFLLIEVADSTLETDRTEKLPAYGRAGVTEVWIVNLNNSTIEIYREPHFTGYARKTIVGPGQSAAPLAFPDAILDVTELFKR